MPIVTDRFLIIAGAEKCGTTSLFGYLATHPGAWPSVRKETDYFRGEDTNLSGYLRCFPSERPAGVVHVESSPGYLAESEKVAPRLVAAVPQARLVFMLRDPVDRLRSSFRFYQSRLHLPAGMSFDRFAQLCLDSDAGITVPEAGVINAWHLGAARRGRYELLLPPFERTFQPDQLLLIDYARLQRDVSSLVHELAHFAGLDPAHFDRFTFGRENASFRARHRGLQRMAVFFNDSLETLWRRHPRLKRQLLTWYKRWNAEPLHPDPLSADTAARLAAYYAPTVDLLRARFG